MLNPTRSSLNLPHDCHHFRSQPQIGSPGPFYLWPTGSKITQFPQVWEFTRQNSKKYCTSYCSFNYKGYLIIKILIIKSGPTKWKRHIGRGLRIPQAKLLCPLPVESRCATCPAHHALVSQKTPPSLCPESVLAPGLNSVSSSPPLAKWVFLVTSLMRKLYRGPTTVMPLA